MIMHLLSKTSTLARNSKTSRIFFFLSPVMVHLAFFRPQCFSIFSFLFLIPIFYLGFYKLLSFKEGFLWGVIFYFLHFYAYIHIFSDDGNCYTRLLLLAFLMFYCAIYPGLWFWLSQTVSNFGSSYIWSFIVWTFFTFLYFIWMNYGCFWIFGIFMGDPFGSPLLPLTQNNFFLSYLHFFGQNIMLLLLLLFGGSTALFFILHKKKYIIFSTIVLSPFFGGIFLKKSDDLSLATNCIKKIGYIPPPPKNIADHPLDAAQEIYYRMSEVIKNNSQIRYIVMPESSYPFCLNCMHEIIEMWHLNALGDTISLLIGAHRKEGDSYFNSLYMIKQGKISRVYDKIGLMPFAESMPKFWNNVSYIKNLFIKKNNFFCAGSNDNYCFNLDDIILEPYICSELFLRKISTAISTKKSTIILLAINDSIFSSSYMKNLMFLRSKFSAMRYSQDILYVGYSFARLITKKGDIINIPRS